ncbi:TOBE domain-containing protein [bacterium]|nr:TOBE domain-containing protein [bacterium]MBU1883182.1 TOBE domain-containing protein [bacterium]
MKISARNQINVKIVEIEEGSVNSVLLLETKNGVKLSSSITNTSVENMALKVGDEVVCFFKASNVLVATGNVPGISARNKIEGVIKEIKLGAVNDEIIISVDSVENITAIITNDALKELKLKEGDKAVAIIKASEVMIAK